MANLTISAFEIEHSHQTIKSNRGAEKQFNCFKCYACSMISNAIIRLVPPSSDLVDDVREALIESYELHKAFLLWAKPNPSREDVSSTMEIAINNFRDKTEEFRFFILRVADSKLVGCVGLIIRDIAIPFFEFGYWVRSSEMGKGYISTAVELLEEYAVSELGAKRLEIKMAESNNRSKLVAERVGFEYEAFLHADRELPSGKVDNTHIYYKTYS